MRSKTFRPRGPNPRIAIEVTVSLLADLDAPINTGHFEQRGPHPTPSLLARYAISDFI